MYEIEGEMEVLPGVQSQTRTQHNRPKNIEDCKGGEPDEYIEKSAHNGGELSPRTGYENEELADKRAWDSIFSFQSLSRSLSDTWVQPGSPEHCASIEHWDPPEQSMNQGRPIIQASAQEAQVRPQKEYSSKSLPDPETMEEELLLLAPPKKSSTPQPSSACVGIAPQSGMFIDIQFNSLSKSRKEKSVNSDSILDFDKEQPRRRMSKRPRRSLSSLKKDKASVRKTLFRKRGSASPAGRTKSKIDFNLPIEQQLRRMRKLRQKRRKQRRSQSIDIRREMPKAPGRVDPHSMKSRRPSMNWSAKKNPTEQKQNSSPVFCSFVGSEDVQEGFQSSIITGEPFSHYGNSNNARHMRASSFTSIIKEPSCFMSCNRKVRKSSGIYGYKSDRTRTSKPRVQSLNRNKCQSKPELPSFSSSNPFERDPGWSQEISRKRKLKLRCKLRQLPCWKVVDDKLRNSKILLCSLCKVNWEYGDTIVTLPCMHVYHKKCIHDWLQNSENCPQCKRSILDDGRDILF